MAKRVYQVWSGNNRFFLCGRLVFGPDVRSLVVTIFLIAVPAVIFCVFVVRHLLHKFPGYNSGYAILVVAVLYTLYVLLLLFLTSSRDPGIIPRAPHPPEPEDDNATPAESAVGQTPRLRFPRTKDVLVNGVTVKSKYCDTCMLYRPPRCSHCSICDNCVERFDHHCPWVGQCVGQRNYRFFFMFVASTTLLCIYVFAMSALYIKFLMDGDSHTVWEAMKQSPASVILMVYTFISVWFVGGLTVFHLFLISTNQGSPCHLYFDLEYNRSANIEANGVEMVDLLLSVVSDAMLDIYCLSFEPDWTVELDSSTEEKFSRHLIIHLPNAAFKDNSHVGAFVGEIRARIARLREIDTKFNKLYIFKEQSCVESHTELFLDSAVYSRNRCFRLPLSSKAGKSVVLLPTGRFKCKDMSDYQMFMDSLICRMDANCKWLLPFDSEAINNGGGITNLPHVANAMKHPRNVSQLCISGQSPFPTLDAFVESIASIENVAGRIRSWYWFSEYDVMVYNIAGNRFCERIGRQHKSNHVMYIVDFRTAGYYQKCYDPDCKGYRSPLRPIPWNTIPGHFPVSCASQIANNGGAKNVDIDHKLSLAMTAGDKSVSSTCNASSTSFIEGIFNENSEKDNWEDEAWWEEVIKTVDDMESRRKPLEYKKQLFEQDCTGTSDELLLDDDWWMAVACKASELEKMTA